MLPFERDDIGNLSHQRGRPGAHTCSWLALFLRIFTAYTFEPNQAHIGSLSVTSFWQVRLREGLQHDQGCTAGHGRIQLESKPLKNHYSLGVVQT